MDRAWLRDHLPAWTLSIPWLWILHGLAILVLIGTWYGEARHPWHNDAYGYWIAFRGGLYDLPWLAHGAYTYSPAFAEAIYPWMLVPWRYAWGLEVAAQLGALALIAGPIGAVVIYYLPWPTIAGYGNPVAATIHNGNMELIIALAVVAAYRWPWAMALVFHTKIVPACAVVWFAVRREWRRLAIAVLPAAAIGLVSFVLAPDLWWQFGALLATAIGENTAQLEQLIPLPLSVRLPIALILIFVGARFDRYWLVPIGAMLALPAIRIGGVAVAVGAVPFLLAGSRLAWLLPAPLGRLWGIGPAAPSRGMASP
jgi:hypothetical protein